MNVTIKTEEVTWEIESGKHAIANLELAASIINDELDKLYEKKDEEEAWLDEVKEFTTNVTELLDSSLVDYPTADPVCSDDTHRKMTILRDITSACKDTDCCGTCDYNESPLCNQMMAEGYELPDVWTYGEMMEFTNDPWWDIEHEG